MTSIADPTAGIADYLLTEVGSFVSGRVFQMEVPKDEDQYMPRSCIVVASGGGSALYGQDFLPLATPIIDCYCYGATRLEAENVARHVAFALKEMERGVREGVCLCWARIHAETKAMVDTDTLWPIALVAAQVNYFPVSPEE